MKTGADLIAAERQRQIDAEGWTPEHDDEHKAGELSIAACCYAEVLPNNFTRGFNAPSAWPWSHRFSNPSWKPKSSGHANDPKRIADLVRAGALIAAEIERLQRIPG